MTLQTFLKRTAPAPPEALRRAMMSALSVERPSSPDSFIRFYQRVVTELDRPVNAPRRSSGGNHAGGIRAA